LFKHHDVGSGKHVRIFQRLVLALGHRQDRHLVRLAKIERRRTDKIADILDEHHRPSFGASRSHRVADHVRVEMTALAGVDLKGGAPVARMRSASLVVCWSPSIT
jgi:hypothetical protein